MIAPDPNDPSQRPGHTNYDWINAYRKWRKANALVKKVEAVIRGTRNVGDHYRYFGGLMYHGAHTGRWSGGGGNSLSPTLSAC